MPIVQNKKKTPARKMIRALIGIVFKNPLLISIFHSPPKLVRHYTRTEFFP